MYLVRNGARLYSRVAGRGDPTVVFVHGTAVDHSIWNQHFAHFSRKHRVIAVDLRGHGRSDSARTYTMELFRDDLAAVIDQLDVRFAVLIGQSSGADIASRVAVDYPRRIAGLVFADYGAARRSESAPWAPSAHDVERRAALLTSEWQTVGAQLMVDQALPDADAPQATRSHLVEVARKTPPDVVYRLLTLNTESRIREEYLRRITVPTLILQSTVGPHLGYRQGAFIKELVPDARLHYVEGRGHWFFLGGADEFQRQVESFVKTL